MVYTCNFLDRQLMSILRESIKADRHLSHTQLGLVTGLAFALVYTVLGIPLAWLADRTLRSLLIVGVWFRGVGERHRNAPVQKYSLFTR